MSSNPVIDKFKCNLCHVCVDICPMLVFGKGENEIIILENKCVACYACEIQCEKKAISVKEK